MISYAPGARELTDRERQGLIRRVGRLPHFRIQHATGDLPPAVNQVRRDTDETFLEAVNRYRSAHWSTRAPVDTEPLPDMPDVEAALHMCVAWSNLLVDDQLSGEKLGTMPWKWRIGRIVATSDRGRRTFIVMPSVADAVQHLVDLDGWSRPSRVLNDESIQLSLTESRIRELLAEHGNTATRIEAPSDGREGHGPWLVWLAGDDPSRTRYPHWARSEDHVRAMRTAAQYSEEVERRTAQARADRIAEIVAIANAQSGLPEAVRAARLGGITWQEIGDALGIRRQSAQARFASWVD